MAKEPPKINSANSPSQGKLSSDRGSSLSEGPFDQENDQSEAHGPSNLRLLRAKRLAILGQTSKGSSASSEAGDPGQSKLTSADSGSQDHHSNHSEKQSSTVSSAPGLTSRTLSGKADHKIEVAPHILVAVLLA